MVVAKSTREHAFGALHILFQIQKYIFFWLYRKVETDIMFFKIKKGEGLMSNSMKGFNMAPKTRKMWAKMEE